MREPDKSGFQTKSFLYVGREYITNALRDQVFGVAFDPRRLRNRER